MEAFCAEHNVHIDEVSFQWPASKFEAMYEAYSRRKIANDLEQRKVAEIGAMWGNPNMDSDDPDLRSKIQSQVEEAYSKVIRSLYGDETVEVDQENIDTEDPFWQAMERGIEKRKLPTHNG